MVTVVNNNDKQSIGSIDRLGQFNKIVSLYYNDDMFPMTIKCSFSDDMVNMIW